VALGGGGGKIGLVPGELAAGLAVIAFALVFVVALIFEFVLVSETETEADPELYRILSNSLFPPNSPLTILSVTTTSNPHPLPSPPPALINPSNPPPSENLDKSKSYSLTSLPFINVDPEEGSEIAHDKNPFPAHWISSVLVLNGCTVGRRGGEGSRAYTEKSRVWFGVHSGLALAYLYVMTEWKGYLPGMTNALS